MTKQSGLTLFSEIIPDKKAALYRTLAEHQKEWFDKKSLSIEKPGTIHFCRWVIVDEIVSESKVYPPKLVFESNFDGKSSMLHLKHLIDDCSDILDAIYVHCVGYDAAYSPSEKLRYFAEKEKPNQVFYNSSPKRDLNRIKREEKLYLALRDHIASLNSSNFSGQETVREMQKFVEGNEAFSWALKREKIPGVHIPGLLLTVGLTLLFLPILIILIIILQIFYERKDKPLGIDPGQVNYEQMKRLERNEDIYYQNQFSQLLFVKKGFLRRFTIRAILLFTKGLGTFLMVKGKLMEIPTIHFARWILFDNDKHMLFTSNFDGSWQQYLGDFIDKSGWGLSAIWSNSVGFPKTYFLFTGGAYNEQQFLAWSRHFQIDSQFWYSAYPTLSIKNIINNSYIRHDLFKQMSEKKALKYLKRF